MTTTTQGSAGGSADEAPARSGPRWGKVFGRSAKSEKGGESNRTSSSDLEQQMQKRPRRTLGILSDRETDEVPGSVLLMPKESEYNEPLGLENAPARASSSSLPSPYLTPSQRSVSGRRKSAVPQKKRTPDGKIILDPQPDESPNDPLNLLPSWRRDASLLSLGLYCLVGGGMTPVLAAGFNNVAQDFDVSVPRVALTTGIYMAGLGFGSAILSPTAILYGKRPVYLGAAIMFIATSVWCGASPSFGSLIAARIFQGIAVSSVECLPSASVAEIYYLHEKAFRLGIYTLLLLGGKNLVPLVSAVIIQSLGWRWVFYIVAMVVGFCGTLLFLFCPETFWDRSPRPHHLRLPGKKSLSRMGSFVASPSLTRRSSKPNNVIDPVNTQPGSDSLAERRAAKRHAHFAADQATYDEKPEEHPQVKKDDRPTEDENHPAPDPAPIDTAIAEQTGPAPAAAEPKTAPTTPAAAHTPESNDASYFSQSTAIANPPHDTGLSPGASAPDSSAHVAFNIKTPNPYTSNLRRQPPKTYLQQLAPYSGRVNQDSWLRVFVRPFILFAYPSILWSTLVYSLSVGWLIVLSESVTVIYKSRDTYNFTSLQAGLVYLSPFIGGVLGTAVAGKVSDIVVRWMSRRNGGVYEPEFRLVMAVPIAITTTIGLCGYGWAAEEKDAWIVPTVFFGIISFGCSLGSTTSITFAVDSYRQYAGEALVTLNFSKNVFHGLVFSLFFNEWLEHDGSKDVFGVIGAIQMAFMLSTIPMYIYGKRARMWTVRKNFMEKF